MVTFISDKRILQVMEKDIFEQHKSHKLQKILMAVKKFVFRENWYGSRWLVWKQPFFCHFRPKLDQNFAPKRPK